MYFCFLFSFFDWTCQSSSDNHPVIYQLTCLRAQSNCAPRSAVPHRTTTGGLSPRCATGCMSPHSWLMTLSARFQISIDFVIYSLTLLLSAVLILPFFQFIMWFILLHWSVMAEFLLSWVLSYSNEVSPCFLFAFCLMFFFLCSSCFTFVWFFAWFACFFIYLHFLSWSLLSFR